MAELLSQSEIDQALESLAGWTQEGAEVRKTFTLSSFPAALVFVSGVGHLAERADHHPDILIQYRKVTFTLSTHSAGGLTQKDIDLAGEIDTLA